MQKLLYYGVTTKTHIMVIANKISDCGPNPFNEIKYPSCPGSTIPRRYEELDISKLQDSSHQHIISIGADIQKRNEKKHEFELMNMVTKVEGAIWTEARVQENRALDETRKEAHVEQQKIAKKLKKEHERLLKEEVANITIRLTEQHNEEKRSMTLRSNRNLRDAVRQMEEKSEMKLALMISETRKQEQQLAKVELARVERENKERIEKVIIEKEEERAHAVLNMVTKLMAEKEKDIQKVKSEEAKKLKTVLDDIKKRQTQDKKRVERVEIEHKLRIEALKEDFNLGKIYQTNLQNKLLSLHHSFHDYVNATSKNANNQAAFLVPPLPGIEHLL